MGQLSPRALMIAICPWVLAGLLLATATSAATPPPNLDAEKTAPSSQAVWSVEARLKQLFDSHTSYEFADPSPEGSNPLSRLEFQMDGWWGGVAIGRRAPAWGLSLEALHSITGGTRDILEDSDWTDEGHPLVRDTYSQTELRMEPSYDVKATLDVSLARRLGLPTGLDLRPLGGVRWQHLDFMAHDGPQSELMPDGTQEEVFLAGNGIRFKQNYWFYFVGFQAVWQPLPQTHPGFQLSAQVDWAYVVADNQDHHLLRDGNRLTIEDTTGDAWHAAVGLALPLGERLSCGLDVDFLAIETTGSHRLVNDLYDLDETWGRGVHVWSRQCGVTLMLTYSF